jgi:structural maintenance of chromosome 1
MIQKPDLVALEAQITHSTRKLGSATNTKAETEKTEAKLAGTVEGYERELVSVKRAADKAQGTIYTIFVDERARMLICDV